MAKLRETENIWILGIFLGVTGLLAALILSVVSQLTAKPIEDAKIRTRTKALKQLNLPEFDNNMSETEVVVGNVKFMTAKKGGKIVGYAAESSNNSGYNGKISALAGFDADGKILAVQILSHNETPGLGAAVCERKFQRTIFNIAKPQPAGLPPNPILDQFNGKSAANTSNWKISKDGGPFIFKTGATVSSRAVAALVESIVLEFPAAQKLLNSGDAK